MHEARNMTRVADNLRAAGIDVLLAAPIKGMRLEFAAFGCSVLSVCALCLSRTCVFVRLAASNSFASLRLRLRRWQAWCLARCW